MKPLRIGIDGARLAGPGDDAVARYGYALAAGLKAAGHQVHGVFGLAVGDEPARRELLFFDRIGAPRRSRRAARELA